MSTKKKKTQKQNQALALAKGNVHVIDTKLIITKEAKQIKRLTNQAIARRKKATYRKNNKNKDKTDYLQSRIRATKNHLYCGHPQINQNLTSEKRLQHRVELLLQNIQNVEM
eukprot:Awhi_evm1s13576